VIKNIETDISNKLIKKERLFMIIILSILITMLLLTIGLNVGIKDFKKLRGIVEDEKLTETIKKFPSNTEICKQTLKKLNKEDVKVEEDNSSKTSVYLVFSNWKSKCNYKNTNCYTRMYSFDTRQETIKI
jgi:cell division protein FtsB